MADLNLVSVANSWQGTVRHNPWSRDYAPAGSIVTSPYVNQVCARPYGWLVRVDPQNTSNVGPNWPGPSIFPAPPRPTTTFVCPLKGRIVATGACGNRIEVYFDITSGSTTWLAPFRDIGVEVLSPVDVDAGGFPPTEASAVIDGFVANMIETGPSNSLIWTDVIVDETHPSVVRPYCKKIVVFDVTGAATSIPLRFVDGYSGDLLIRVQTGTVFTVPSWASIILPTGTDRVQIIQTIDPSGVAS